METHKVEKKFTSSNVKRSSVSLFADEHKIHSFSTYDIDWHILVHFCRSFSHMVHSHRLKSYRHKFALLCRNTKHSRYAGRLRLLGQITKVGIAKLLICNILKYTLLYRNTQYILTVLANKQFIDSDQFLRLYYSVN